MYPVHPFVLINTQDVGVVIIIQVLVDLYRWIGAEWMLYIQVT